MLRWEKVIILKCPYYVLDDNLVYTRYYIYIYKFILMIVFEEIKNNYKFYYFFRT